MADFLALEHATSPLGITRGVRRTLCGRSLTQKVTFPVGGAAEGSGVTSYMENRGSWRVISKTWNWVLACGSDTRDRVQTDVEQKKRNNKNKKSQRT